MPRVSVKYRSIGQAVALDRKLARLSAAGFAAAKERCAIAIEQLIIDGFTHTRDPVGHRWAPRKPPTGSWELLFKTATMFESFIVDNSGRSLKIYNRATERGRPYPLFHQRGTVYMPARKMLPDKYLSPKWRAELRRVTALALAELR